MSDNPLGITPDSTMPAFNFRFDMFGERGLMNQELDVCDDGNNAT